MVAIFGSNRMRFLCVLLVFASADYAGAGKDVPVSHIEAVAGDPVYLPCDISTSDVNDQVLLVLWYREDLGTPIYSVDGRDRDFSLAERWSDENVFANRAYFMPEKQPAELGVDHIRDSDQAVYRCRVDFKVAQTRNSKVNLTVIVPPQKIVITNETGSALDSFAGPFKEGDSVMLRCDVFGAKPLPTVTWYRNDIMITNVSVALPSAGTTHVRSELKITGLGRNDLHSELTCQASNNPKTAPLASTLHVDMNFAPLNVILGGLDDALVAGRRYLLNCQSGGSRPPATLTWWMDGVRQQHGTIMTTLSGDDNVTTSTLDWNITKKHDGKTLTCRAENSLVSSEKLEASAILKINYTPEAKIILGTSLNPDSIREGTDVYFDCVIDARPPVYKIEWMHNNKTLYSNVQAGIIIANHSLVLQGVSRATAGDYTCKGFNLLGDGESNSFYLNVLYAPTCKPNQTRIYGVAKQEHAHISCQVDANPTEVVYRWTFNNSAEFVDVAESHINRSGTSSIVSYTPINEHDYGTLLCYATNKIGTQRVPCVFHIIAAGRPDQVHNCTVSNISMTSFSIRCSEGFNGGLPQSFLLEVRESQSQEIKSNLSSPIPRFSVTSLEAGAQYQAALFSYNLKGRSEPVILQAATLRLPEKQLTAEKDNHRSGLRFTPMMSVLIGIVTALLIVGLVVILLVRLQCTQNDDRRKRHKGAPVTGGSAEHRGSTSGPTLSDKGGGSPVSKHDSSAGECDSDEKNPDIIPQPVDADETADYVRKRQHISTIETSPSRSLLHQAGNSGGGVGGYISYCTLRNGMPLHELAAQSKMHGAPPPMMGTYAACTLPRQPHQQWQYGPVSHLPPGVYPVPYRGPHPQPRPRPQPREPPIPMQPLAATEEEPSADTPLMINKRESTV